MWLFKRQCLLFDKYIIKLNTLILQPRNYNPFQQHNEKKKIEIDIQDAIINGSLEDVQEIVTTSEWINFFNSQIIFSTALCLWD